jgi:hypothetical protein
MRDQTVNKQLALVTAMLAHPSALITSRLLLRMLTGGARA